MTVKVPVPTETFPKTRAPLLVSETLLVPLLERLTLPVKTLFCVSVMAAPPAEKLAVPGMVKIPVCVMAPLAVAESEPLLCKVRVGKVIAAPLKLSVKLRKLVSEASAGKLAKALELVRLKSWILPSVPLKLIPPLRLLA